jgi:hypothetical protein
MPKMKKQALLIALPSALALGAVTTSFAQGARQYGDAQRYDPMAPTRAHMHPSYGNDNGASGGSDY